MIDISNYKVVYCNRVYNAVSILYVDSSVPRHNDESHYGLYPIRELSVLVIDENCNFLEICDEAHEFQFIPKQEVRK